MSATDGRAATAEPAGLEDLRSETGEKTLGRVLVVDDDATVRLLAAAHLRKAGFEVAVVGDGRGALAEFTARPAAVVLLDLQLPDIDGFEVCRQLRATAAGAGASVMMLTGQDDDVSIERAFAAGANDFFTKPINWRLLRYRVAFVMRATATVEALRRSEERYALAAEGANDGLWDWDLASGGAFYSDRWKAMIGFSPSELDGTLETLFCRVPREDAERLRTAIDAHLAGASEGVECEHRILHRDGAYRWVINRALARFVDGRPTRLAGSLTDVTERRAAEEQLAYGAVHDSLTGLPNRTLFLDRLQNSLDAGRRSSREGVALLFIDLDHFKLVNDSRGHAVGDRVLIEIAQRLRSSVRVGDTVARLGGDEFTVLCQRCTEAGQVATTIERILDALRAPVAIGDQSLVVSASIGVALSRTGYGSADDMLRDADIAMYRAKAQGRSRYEVFDEAMREGVLRRVAIETDLRRALGSEEISAYFQPIVRLREGGLVGAEALMRWHHPKRGLVTPDEFLPTAEAAGLIVPLGRRVLNLACNHLAAWRRARLEAAEWRVSVNVSAQELTDPAFLDGIDRELKACSLAPSALQLELTESTLIESDFAAARVLGVLSERGVRLAIDDFGTGYSSLSYLQRFPFRVLKIDKSFVMGLSPGDRRTEIVRAIVTLADGLGLEVVAEGVDSPVARDCLLALGCDLGQGFELGRPQPPERLASSSD